MSQSTGDRNRTCDLLVQSQTQLPTVATPGQVMRRTERCWLSLRQARGRGFEPLSPDSKSGSLPLADPRISFVESAMRESNPPVQLGRLAPSADRPMARISLQAEGARVELARQCQCSTAFEAAAITNWLALPSFSSGGRNRTCTRVRLTGGCLTVWPHRNVSPPVLLESGRSDLNRRSRGSGPRGIPDFPTS